MSGWLTDGCAPEWKPLAPITVRHHRTALLLLYRTLDGSTAENPVASTFRPKDPPPEPRAPSLANVQRVLSTIRPSKTRARLMLILTTGLPHKQVMKLKREHWDREQRRLYVTRRSKGQGAPARVLPLSDAATKALIEFDRWDAWGDFSPSPIQRLIRETCKALGIPYFRPYDLRHLHGTLVYQQTGDLTTTARLLGHVDTKTAERYTQAAWMEVDTAAQAKVGAIMETIMETKENSPE